MKILSALLVLFSFSAAQAGVMKDLVLEHQESVAMVLYGVPDIDMLEIRKTDFVRPTLADAKVALESVVMVYVPRAGENEEVLCVSEFQELAPRRFKLLQTRCR